MGTRSARGATGSAPSARARSAQRANGTLPSAGNWGSPPVVRLVIFSAAAILLVFLLWYGYRYNPAVTLQMCLSDPQRYDGTEIGIGAEATVIAIHDNGFDIRQMGKTIRVSGDPRNAAVGDFVQMRAIYRQEGYLQLRQLYVAKGRRLKIIASIAPTLLVAFLFYRHYRFDTRKLLFRERG